MSSLLDHKSKISKSYLRKMFKVLVFFPSQKWVAIALNCSYVTPHGHISQSFGRRRIDSPANTNSRKTPRVFVWWRQDVARGFQTRQTKSVRRNPRQTRGRCKSALGQAERRQERCTLQEKRRRPNCRGTTKAFSNDESALGGQKKGRGQKIDPGKNGN